MKKLLFLLLFPLLGTGGLLAAVTVTPLSVDYSTKKVTFRVEWTGSPTNDRVWVWIDLSPITGTSPGTFDKAIISGATATISGSITTVLGNTRGFYVTASPSTVTATLSNTPVDKFNWCVYGSDAPPNVTAAGGIYTLNGTPPFTLIAANGTTTQTVTAKTIATSAVTITPVTLTDETGYPGVFCIYTGSDLIIDADHLCQERAGGAQNWEAWIKDSRDDEYYRIVLMPDNKWWLAQNVKYEQSGSILFQNCGKDSCGRFYTNSQIFGGNYGVNRQSVCPPQWVLPSVSQWVAMTNAISGTLTTAILDLRSLQIPCNPRPDNYGWAARGRSSAVEEAADGDIWHAPTGSAANMMTFDNGSGNRLSCGSTASLWPYEDSHVSWHCAVRCLRP